MEEKKKKKRLGVGLICLIALVVVVGAATAVAAVSGVFSNNSEYASDKQLRKQLADASVTEVTISEDTEVSSPLPVNGTKVISGTGKLVAAFDYKAEDNTGLLTLAEGASVTIQGSVSIDADTVDCGIYVAAGAVLTIRDDVQLINAEAANVYSLGEVTQSGGTVEAGYDNVYIADQGSFLWEGGYNRSSVNHGIHIEEDASLHTTSDKAEMREAGSHGIYLAGSALIDDIFLLKSGGNQIDILPTGKLTLNGGDIAYGKSNGINNRGVITMNGGSVYNSEYGGVINTNTFTMNGGGILNNSDKGLINKNGSKAIVTSADASIGSNASGILNEENAYCELANANVSGNKANNVINYGEIRIHDITLRSSGSNSVNTQYGGHTTLDNVVIDGTGKNHGIYCSLKGVIELSNVTIKGTAGRGIQNYDGTITGSNVVFEDIGTAAIASMAMTRRGGGTITLDKVTTKNVATNSVYTDAKGAGTITITNSTFGPTGQNNISVKAGEVYLTNVKVQGNMVGKGESTHAVYLTDGKLYMKNCSTIGTEGSAIRNNGGYVELDNHTFGKVTIHNIFASAGTTVLKNSTLAKSDYHHVYAKDTAVVNIDNCTFEDGVNSNVSMNGTSRVTVTNSTMGKTTSNNVRVSDGTLALKNVKILGTDGDSIHGVYISAGKANLEDVFVTDAEVAIRNNGGYLEAKGLTTENCRKYSIHSSDTGNTVIKSSVIGVNANQNSVYASNGKITLEDTTVLGTTKKDCHAVYATGGEIYVKNSTIQDTAAAAIRNNGGHIETSGLTTKNVGTYNVYTTKGKTVIDKSNLCTTTTQNNVYVKGGTLYLKNSSVMGTTKANCHGVYVTEGEAIVTNTYICDTTGAAIRVNTKGSAQVSSLVTKNIGQYIVYHSSTGTTRIKDSTIAEPNKNNQIYVTTAGKVFVENCRLEPTSADNSIKIEGGALHLTNSSILGTTKSGCHGIYATGGEVYVKNATIQDTTGAALRNNGGYIEASNLTTENVGTYNVHLTNGEIVIDKSNLCATTTQNNLFVNVGTLYLTNSSVMGTTKDGCHGVYVTNGDVIVTNTYICDTAGAAVRVNTNGSAQISGLKTENIGQYIIFHSSTGTTTIKDSTLPAPAKNNQIYVTTAGEVLVENCVLEQDSKLTDNNVKVTGGTVTFKNTQILGTVSGSLNAIYSTGGTVNVLDTYIANTTAAAIRNDGATVLVDNLKTENIATYSVFASKGATTIQNCEFGVSNSGDSVRINQSNEAGQIILKGKVVIPNLVTNVADTRILIDGVLSEGSNVVLNPAGTVGNLVTESNTAGDMAANLKYLTLVEKFTSESMNLIINDKNAAQGIIGIDTNTDQVARVEGVTYDSLQEAVNAAAATADKTATVEILKHIYLTEAVTIPEGSNLTIVNDDNSHTIVRYGTWTEDQPLFTVGTGVTLTLASTLENEAVLTIDGGSLTSPVISVEGGTLNLTGVAFAGDALNVSVADGTVNLDGKNVLTLYVSQKEMLYVRAGFDQASEIILTYGAEAVKGDIFAICETEEAAKKALASITLSGDNLSGCVLELSGTNLVLNRGIARVGGNLFETLQEAVTYVDTLESKTGTVEILSNIVLTETVTIPAGANVTITDDGVTARTISRSDSWTGSTNPLFSLGAGSSLTLKGTSGDDKNITLTVDGNKEKAAISTTSRMVQIPSGTTLNIEAGVKISNHKIIDAVGGAISVEGGTLKMSGGVIDSNEAVNKSATGTAQGGAVNVATAGSAIDITGGTFSNNYTDNHGGALRINVACTANIKNVTFTGNISKTGHGGAIRTQDVVLVLHVDNCIFDSNEANYGGGIGAGATKAGAALEVTNCKFTDNKSYAGGGGVNLPSSMNVTLGAGNTFSGNTGGTGTDVRVVAGTLKLTGKHSFAVHIYNAGPSTLTVLDGFDTESKITVTSQTAVSAGYKVVECSSAETAEAVIGCFELSGSNIGKYGLGVSGTNLVLVTKTNSLIAFLVELLKD